MQSPLVVGLLNFPPMCNLHRWSFPPFSVDRRFAFRHWLLATEVPDVLQQLMSKPGRWIKDSFGEWTRTVDSQHGGRRIREDRG